MHYTGGVVVQDGIRYATVATPPDGDNSTKAATTAFVQKVADELSNQIEDVAGSVNREMFPTVQAAVYSNRSYTAPTGGTWYCCVAYNSSGTATGKSGVVSGGGLVTNGANAFVNICIKIA